MTQLLLAEWTKLRTVPRWLLTLAATAVLTIGVTVLNAAGTSVSGGGGGGEPADLPANHQDAGTFRYQRLAGDGSLVARVATQAGSHEWARAGLMLRTDERRGSAHAAIMVTPGHGVHLQSAFGDTDLAGSTAGAPRWLRLDRAGTTVTGYESADGNDWHRVGTVEVTGLTGGADLGLFVASPDLVRIDRQFGGESMTGHPTTGEATFDGIHGDATGAWQDGDHSMPPTEGRVTDNGGTVTLAGAGDVGPTGDAEDRARMTLAGVLLGLMAVVALAVLFVTAEYKRGMILATFAATPRRGRVLAAKALVLGSATFAVGLVASFGAFLLGSALLGAKGLAMPSIGDDGVLRAIVGTAALFAVVAVFSLAVATILRRSAAAITVVLLLLLVPQVIATGLPLSVAAWLGRLTPAAGFAIQETVERYDTAIDPWAGFGVLCAYTVVALAVAARRLARRDA